MENRPNEKENKCKKELTYLAAASIIRKVMESGRVSKKALRELNAKCAELMDCKPTSVG